MPGADGRDHAAHFLVGEHFVFARFVGVDDFASQRQDGLILAQPAPFGAAAGRIALDQIQLAESDVAAGAIAELAGQAAAGKSPFAFAEQGLRLAGRFAGLGRQHRFLGDHAGRFGILFEITGEKIADGRIHQPFDFDVVQLHLRLRFEFRLGHANADDGRQPFAEILAGRSRGL